MIDSLDTEDEEMRGYDIEENLYKSNHDMIGYTIHDAEGRGISVEDEIRQVKEE